MTDAAHCRFLFLHLAAPGLGWQALAQAFASAMQGVPDARVVGSFMGLFGIGSHELFALVAGPAADDALEARVRAALPANVQVVDVLVLRATARPASDAPLVRDGVFVFRFFDVRDGDVEEIVRLSRTAWETFEKPAAGASSGGAAYASEPVGLFRFANAAGPDARGRMLLLTWYDDLTSWERSRTPAPEATANFRRRAALTTGTIAFATRHVPQG
jgi:hypothetical protein